MNRYIIPVIVFLVAGAIGAFTSWAAYTSATEAEQARFETLASDVADSVSRRLGQHLSLLQATRSFFDALGGPANGRAFDDFVTGLDLDGEYDGVQGLGFALRIEADEEAAAEEVILRNYGIEREVWPETDQTLRTPIILLAPQDFRNEAALGFDMFSETVRRSAMRAALNTGDPRASGPVQLAQEITTVKQTGFLVFLPYFQQVETADADTGETFVSGFVYAPFRAQDLFTAALSNTNRLPVVLEAFDVTDGEPELLYRSQDAETLIPDSTYMTTITLNVAGRLWMLQVHSTSGFNRGGARDLALVLGVVSLLLASALGVSAHAQLRAAHTARQLHAISDQNLQEKELMLQEMKHRIKNSIARILAMARQTASHSDNLSEFSESFASRMQAMATAQDMLTRSHWQRAALDELLSRELEQVLDKDADNSELSGPDVELDEKAVQSLGLTFHELATNALKYGGHDQERSSLSVTWNISGKRGSKMLNIAWHEKGIPSTEPKSRGFGTKLIDASVRGELGGVIERIYGEQGFKAVISIPARHFNVGSKRGRQGGGSGQSESDQPDGAQHRPE